MQWKLDLGLCLAITGAALFFIPPFLGGVEIQKPGKGMVNGVNTIILHDLSDRLRKDPKAGKATFFSDTKWVSGMKSITTLSGYEIDGKMRKAQERQFILRGDEINELGATDSAPSAIEEMMHAIGTCIVATANANAALMGVKLTKMQVQMENDINLRGLLDLYPKGRTGVLHFRTTITIAGGADEATLKKIAAKGYELSPVSDTVRKGAAHSAPLRIIVEKSH